MNLINMKKILIVDDQYALRELVELTLESDYEIIKSESGQDALKKIEENKKIIEKP